MEIQELVETHNASGLHLAPKEQGSPAAVVELPCVSRMSPRRHTNSV